jgi:hypothetical protein
MQNDANLSIPTTKRVPWNKGRFDPKRTLIPKCSPIAPAVPSHRHESHAVLVWHDL